jgi:hypothetical protein
MMTRAARYAFTGENQEANRSDISNMLKAIAWSHNQRKST